jgi:hypothetical protein
MMDKFVEVRRQYPKAKISYIGHSNGTYLLAGALQAYPFAHFHRVVFANSVVRKRFPWSSYEPKNVLAVLNLVASRDWVLASLPRCVDVWRVLDLGSAGHDGFGGDGVVNLRFVSGAHSAGIAENMWKDIAGFIVDGRVPNIKIDPAFVSRRRWPVVAFGYLSPVLIPAVAAGLLGILYVLLAAIGGWWVPNKIASSGLWNGFISRPNLPWVSLIAFVLLLRFFAIRL